MILAARKAFLYLDGEPWTKKGEDIFDVGMGFFDGAEICEMVGLFLLEELQELGINVGIYRDDGLGVCDLTPRGVEKMKKKMSAIFRKHKPSLNFRGESLAEHRHTGLFTSKNNEA